MRNITIRICLVPLEKEKLYVIPNGVVNSTFLEPEVILRIHFFFFFLAGVTVGMKNWLRITFAVEPSVL